MNRLVYVAFYKVVYDHLSGEMDRFAVHSLYPPKKNILYLAFVY